MSDIIDVNTLFGPLPSASTDLTVESLLELMGRFQVIAACTLSTLGMLLDPLVGNTITSEICQQQSGLYPVATLNPRLYVEDDSTTDRILSSDYVMLRFFPGLQGWPITFEPFRVLVKSIPPDLPIMVDIRTPGEITALSDTLNGYAGMVILAGVAEETISEAIHVLRNQTNWLMETSHLLATGCIKAAVNSLGAERLLFGSCSPSRAFSSVLRTLQYAELTGDGMDTILSYNAQRILRLKR